MMWAKAQDTRQKQWSTKQIMENGEVTVCRNDLLSVMVGLDILEVMYSSSLQ